MLALPLIGGLLISGVYPFLALAALSLSKSSLGRLFLKGPIPDNYLGLFRDGGFLASLLRTVLFAVPISMIELAIGVAIAVLLQSNFANGRWLRGLVLLPLMTPPMMVAIAWRLILAPSGGLLNGLLLRWGLVDQPISFLGTMPWAFLSVALADIW
jgi:multiple sugar transport system permease protein